VEDEAQNDVAQAGYRALRIEDLPQDLKPRERLKKVGAKNVSDDTLLAVILRVGVVGANAVETAKRLIVEFGTLDALAAVSSQENVARKIPGIGETKALQIVAAMELGRRCSYLSLMRAKDGGGKYIRTTEDAYDLLLPLVYGSRQEHFYVILLGPRNKVLAQPIEIAKGQRDEVALQPNLVFERPMREGAKAIVVAHNHPSGDPMPSEGDLELNAKLLEASKLLNIQILDHVIIGVPSNGNSGFFSMAAACIGGF